MRIKPDAECSFSTDTATLGFSIRVVYATTLMTIQTDRWSDWDEELAEINDGNVLFAAMGTDLFWRY